MTLALCYNSSVAPSMSTEKIHDAIIIGGGPVGCRVASGLARAGYSVAVLEQKPTLDAPVCCTGLVSQECLLRFHLDPGLILKSFNSARIFSPSGKELRLERDEVQAHVLNRIELDKVMCQEAVVGGADYLLSHQVIRLETNGNGVSAEVRIEDRLERFKARAAVLATGSGSRLLGQLGIKRGADWVMGTQAVVETGGAAEVEIYTGRYYAPGFFAWLVPAGGNLALAGLMSRRNTSHHLLAFLKSLYQSGKITGYASPMFRGITLSPPSKTYGERLLVVGDAAGQVKPLTGGGLYFGLLCADIAVRHLVAALCTDKLTAKVLLEYEREWRSLLGRELMLGRLARRSFGILGDVQIEFLFGLINRCSLAERLAGCRGIGFDWHGAAISRAWRMLIPSG